MKKIVAEKFARDRRKIFDQRRNQQSQKFLFLSFASIVTGGPVTQIWAKPNPMFQEKNSSSEAKRDFS